MRVGVITLTQGNINNDHLYLKEIIAMFPLSAVGGSNESERAELLLEIHSGIGAPFFTDIAGDKRIFRKRAWVAEFFQVHELKAGDQVVVEKTGFSRFHVYPVRRF
jgi:hypothetical protein